MEWDEKPAELATMLWSRGTDYDAGIVIQEHRIIFWVRLCSAEGSAPLESYGLAESVDEAKIKVDITLKTLRAGRGAG